MMMVPGRTFLAAVLAHAAVLLFAANAFPSYETEAGRKYELARQRVVELKRSSKRQRYRSYWMDCIRTFELVEKKYPRSSKAGDACVEKAGLYLDLYKVNRSSRDKNNSLKAYSACQSSFSSHARAPEALFRMIEISLDHNKDSTTAKKTYAKLAADYPGSSWTTQARNRLGLRASEPKKETELRSPPGTEIRSAGSASAPGALGMVKGIRHWSGSSYTRIVIDMDRQARTFQTYELKEPDRLVFDFQGMRADEAIGRDPIVLNDGVLRQVRSSQFSPDTVRVVLDLASIKSYAAFPLHEPDRFVIDVNGESSADRAAPDAPSSPAAPSSGVTPDAGEKLSLSRQLQLKIRTIAIDAGHGGHDPGAIGKRGTREKDITLDIAKRLAALVKEKLDCAVVMTRDKDVFIPLEDRPAIARTKGADLFVSVHVNANRKRTARGIETYIQSLTASDRDAMTTAARENAMSTKKLSELKSELDRIFADLTRDDKLEESLHLAHAVQGSLIDTMKPVQKRVADLGVKRAFFYVLINTEMPSILAEVGFISNPDEEKLLRTESYRQKVAEALLQGIKQYVESRKPQVMGI